MAKTLIIVESPTKIKTLRKFLGKDYLFESSLGHIRDLPPRSFGIDLDHDFTPQYEILENKEEAEALLLQNQKDALAIESVRFSICATFVNGNDTTWREVTIEDPEETICQVFDTFTGTYTQCANKTEAFALNEQKKQAFLASVGLDKVYEVDSMPTKLGSLPQPISEGTQSL